LLSKNLNIKIHRTSIWFLFYTGVKLGCLLREERKLRVFEKRVLRKIFGPKKDKVAGKWRKLHNEEINDLYSSPNTVQTIKSGRMRWAGHLDFMGERRGVYRVLVGKPKGRRPLGKIRRRWEDNIKIELQEVGCGCMN